MILILEINIVLESSILFIFYSMVEGFDFIVLFIFFEKNKIIIPNHAFNHMTFSAQKYLSMGCHDNKVLMSLCFQTNGIYYNCY